MWELLTERELEVNCTKSGVIAPGSGGEEWKGGRCTQGIGERWELFAEKTTYRYLGVTVSKSSGMVLFRGEMERKAKREAGRIMGVAGQMMSRARTAMGLWQMAAKNRVLFAAAVVPYTPSWLKKVEVSQNDVARWILGVSKNARTRSLRGLLGWERLEEAAARRKLCWLVKIRGLPENRLPRQVWEEMVVCGGKSRWLKETMGYCETYGLEGVLTMEEKVARKEIKRSIRRFTRREWTKKGCPEHGGSFCAGRGNLFWLMVDNYTRLRTMRRLAVGDVYGATKVGGNTCPKCGEKVGCMFRHIMRQECGQNCVGDCRTPPNEGLWFGGTEGIFVIGDKLDKMISSWQARADVQEP